MGRWLPATVPGSVHTDLLAAGLIPDLYLDLHELALGWIGWCDWRYASTFDWSDEAHERTDLVFDGLDTIATVRLNGEPLGSTENMHRTFRFPVEHRLRSGPNVLEVEFVGPREEILDRELDVGHWPHVNPHGYNQIRKMACNFGWDWGPDLATAGLWRPVWLEQWSTARLAAVRPRVAVEGAVGRVALTAELDWTGSDPGPMRLVGSVGEVRAEVEVERGAPTATLSLAVDGVERWWPHSLGGQPLYPLVVTLLDGDRVLDIWQRRIGFRTVSVDTAPDKIGSRWQLVVNDTPIWVRGANWIPDDCFPSRVDRSRYLRRLEQAVDANVDLLRVWGGGIYEDDAFYELCDELGIMVFQDFPFSCAAYPETPELVAEVEAEARDNIGRLAPHPSLAVWNGNNECLWGHEDWGWKDELGDRPWGEGYWFGLLPRVLAELDPDRPYWPGSPWSGSRDLHPNDERHGTAHVWDVWNGRDYEAYRDHTPRFVAEFGFQGPPAMATLRRAVPASELGPETAGMAHRQKATDGVAKLRTRLEEHFPWPSAFEDWHFLTQVNQARAITLAIEHFRSSREVCSGSIVWQLNDCWPVISWSAVDGDGRRKPMWYALRRAYTDQLLTIQPGASGLSVVLVNDASDAWTQEVRLRRVDLTGRVLADEVVGLEAGAAGAARALVPRTAAAAGDARSELLVADAGTLRSVWSWVPDRELCYTVADVAAEVEAIDGGCLVRVTARGLVRDLCLLVDQADPDAVVDEMLVTLLPGETATFRVTSGGVDDPDTLGRRPVLRCVNDVPELVRAS
jgi:beta-mannosidase